MRVVFFGTPEWAVPFLEALAASRHEVDAVVTAPDAPVGRSRRPQPPPVKRAAAELGIAPVLQPATLKDRGAREEILRFGSDALVVVAYGRILPGRLLDAPRHGAVNVHFSLLPRHRGASPVQHAILHGDKRTGVTTMLMTRGLDEGPILLQQATTIGERETAGELGARLAVMGAPLLVETLDRLEEGTLLPTPQPPDGVSLAPRLTPDMGRVAWDRPAAEIDRMVRAFDPWPPVVTWGPRGRLRLLEVRPADEPAPEGARPGEVLGRRGDSALVACGGGTVLELARLQPDGGRPMTGAAALAGRHLREGGRLGSGP
ncbi:MAG: methionyl-tRNA formyltransferase [Acidobacteria bacterium]|nr:MAG: methionyl-tRNA formyltransferase [Acidobacteriota bacterium]